MKEPFNLRLDEIMNLDPWIVKHVYFREDETAKAQRRQARGIYG